MANHSDRRKSRELALQISFQNEYSKDLNINAALEYFSQSQPLSKSASEYAIWLLEGLKNHGADVDGIIEKASSNWKISRMALVDLSILRVATLEMHFSKEEIPTNVAINEALEMAKKYGSTESAVFINGVLDQVSREEK